MKNIKLTDKIIIFTHADLDGSACALLFSHVFKNITIIDSSFYRIDKQLEELNFDDYDYVFLTDIHPENKKNAYISDKIIILDHHESALDLHNISKMHYIVVGHCATHLVKKFLEKYFNVDLSIFSDMVKLVNDYDMFYLEYDDSKKLNDLMFYRYRPKKFRKLFKNGRVVFTDNEIKWLEQHHNKFLELYSSLTIHLLDKINGCVVITKTFINEICDRIMKEENINVIFCFDPYRKRISIRSNIEGLNTGLILKDLGWGGGHDKASGFFCLDENDFYDKINILEEIFHKQIEELK